VFSSIINGKMNLNGRGRIVDGCWKRIPEHFPNVVLDEYKILLHALRATVTGLRLPNHVHGIILLNEYVVGTRHAVSLPKQFGKPASGSVSTIVRSLKSAAAKRIKETHLTSKTPIWQPRYYDQIIRDERELQNIRDYIDNNVLTWAFEKEHPENIPL